MLHYFCPCNYQHDKNQYQYQPYKNPLKKTHVDWKLLDWKLFEGW